MKCKETGIKRFDKSLQYTAQFSNKIEYIEESLASPASDPPLLELESGLIFLETQRDLEVLQYFAGMVKRPGEEREKHRLIPREG